MAKANRINDSTGEPYWKRRDPEKVKRVRLKYRLKSEYGLTLEQYDDMLDTQSYCCWTCGLPLLDFLTKNICVDHCHATGKVRGILCGKCNKALGLVDESLETLREMINYLEYYGKI